MRIGVVSDTHNNLANVENIVEIFNALEVDRVVHTGDITQSKVLDVLARLNAPVIGVFGNNDHGERQSLVPRARQHGIELSDGPLELEWLGRRIIVVHDPLDLEACMRPHHDLALHGHTHLYRQEEVRGTIVFNPGESAGTMRGHNAVGLVDLQSLCCDVHRF